MNTSDLLSFRPPVRRNTLLLLCAWDLIRISEFTRYSAPLERLELVVLVASLKECVRRSGGRSLEKRGESSLSPGIGIPFYSLKVSSCAKGIRTAKTVQ